MVFGKLVIFVSGNKAINDQVVPKERVNELGDYVRARISDAPTAPAQIPATTPTPGEDPEHRLRRVQRMLDDGLLSPDEFEERRRVILADL